MKKTCILVAAGAVLSGMFLISCTSDPYVQRGRVGGAALGAATGAIIGNNVRGGNSWGGAAIGAAVGGLAGDQWGKRNSMYYRSRYATPYYGGGGYYGAPTYGRGRYYRYY